MEVSTKIEFKVRPGSHSPWNISIIRRNENTFVRVNTDYHEPIEIGKLIWILQRIEHDAPEIEAGTTPAGAIASAAEAVPVTALTIEPEARPF